MRMSFKCLVPEPMYVLRTSLLNFLILINVCIQCFSEKNDWLLASNIKSYQFWAFILMTYIAFAAIIFSQHKKSTKINKWKFNKLDFFAIMLSQGLRTDHLPTNTLMRMLFVDLLLLTIIFVTIYNSHISSVITIPT